MEEAACTNTLKPIPEESLQPPKDKVARGPRAWTDPAVCSPRRAASPCRVRLSFRKRIRCSFSPL